MLQVSGVNTPPEGRLGFFARVAGFCEPHGRILPDQEGPLLTCETIGEPEDLGAAGGNLHEQSAAAGLADPRIDGLERFDLRISQGRNRSNIVQQNTDIA